MGGKEFICIRRVEVLEGEVGGVEAEGVDVVVRC